ncbi:MAG: hypothetical protein CML46_07810 [Rhodobacteraceae bacterium]|nr:hypothetical protein [Paracoccaceae bacterium]
MRDGATEERETDDREEETSLADVIDRLAETGGGDGAGDEGGDGDGDGEVTVNALLDTFADRSLGVLLTALGFVAALPIIGDIPGVSALTGSLILLALARHAVAGGSLRLPGRLGRRSVTRAKMRKALDRARPWAARVDRVLKPRLTRLTTGGPARTALAVTAGIMAICFFPLIFVPFGVKAPSLAVLALGLARMTRDGYAAVLGYALALATLGVLWGGFGLISSALG